MNLPIRVACGSEDSWFEELSVWFSFDIPAAYSNHGPGVQGSSLLVSTRLEDA